MNDWYGFGHGAKSFQGNQHKEVCAKFLHTPDSADVPSTQKDLAQDYGISHQTMNNYMRLAKAIPELEDLVNTGILGDDATIIDVMQWMISHQDARRNLSPGELIYANSMVAEEIALYSGSVVKTKIRVFYNELISYKEQGEDIGAPP